MSKRGRRPSCIACCESENAPEITAWDAITVAVASSTTGTVPSLSHMILNTYMHSGWQ